MSTKIVDWFVSTLFPSGVENELLNLVPCFRSTYLVPHFGSRNDEPSLVQKWGDRFSRAAKNNIVLVALLNLVSSFWRQDMVLIIYVSWSPTKSSFLILGQETVHFLIQNEEPDMLTWNKERDLATRSLHQRETE